MRNTTVVLLAALSLAGCNKLSTVKVDNPVLGPPPPRVALAQSTERRSDITPRPFGGDETSEISQVSIEQPTTPTGEFLHGSQVVATVNNAPIFDSEVLERYGLQLDKASRELSPKETQQLRRQLIQRDLQGYIDRKLLVQTLRSTLKKEQVEMLDAHLNGLFEQEVNRLKGEMKVNTRHEVELKLAEQGTSLENLRNSFANQRMAMEYLGAKAQNLPESGRPDMLRYYEKHIDDYTTPAQVKWQQIVVSFDKHGGKRGALAELEKLIDELKAKADFGEVARKYSDGVTAESGGRWDWTQKGSLADKRTEKALFELPEGSISQVFVGKNDYQLVRVVSRRQTRQIPFAKVQDEIKGKLKKEQRTEATKNVLEELYANAVIDTIFDKR
jgi:parvulin-like peptidyl-prolyl isomerase